MTPGHAVRSLAAGQPGNTVSSQCFGVRTTGLHAALGATPCLAHFIVAWRHLRVGAVVGCRPQRQVALPLRHRQAARPLLLVRVLAGGQALVAQPLVQAVRVLAAPATPLALLALALRAGVAPAAKPRQALPRSDPAAPQLPSARLVKDRRPSPSARALRFPVARCSIFDVDLRARQVSQRR